MALQIKQRDIKQRDNNGDDYKIQINQVNAPKVEAVLKKIKFGPKTELISVSLFGGLIGSYQIDDEVFDITPLIFPNAEWIIELVDALLEFRTELHMQKWTNLIKGDRGIVDANIKIVGFCALVCLLSYKRKVVNFTDHTVHCLRQMMLFCSPASMYMVPNVTFPPGSEILAAKIFEIPTKKIMSVNHGIGGSSRNIFLKHSVLHYVHQDSAVITEFDEQPSDELMSSNAIRSVVTTRDYTNYNNFQNSILSYQERKFVMPNEETKHEDDNVFEEEEFTVKFQPIEGNT